MRHLRIASTIRLGAAGAVLAVFAVLTPAAAFGSDDTAPAGVAAEPTAQTEPSAPSSPSAQPDESEPTDEPEAPVGDPTEVPDPTETPDPTEAPDPVGPSTTPAQDAPVTPAGPSPAQATDDPDTAAADSAPSVRLEQYERVGGAWKPSDGSVDFDTEIRYVLRVVVPGAQTLPAAQVRAHVPGWDRSADQVTNVPARLVAGSAKCTGSVACDVEANQNTGQVIWRLGDLVTGDQGVELTAEFTVRFGQLPLDVRFDTSGKFTARAWCRGELSWGQGAARTAEVAAPPVYSNAVVATAVAQEAIIGTPVSYPSVPGTATAGPGKDHHSAAGPATVLPNTGGPQLALAAAGTALVLLGGVTVARSRRR